LNNHSCQGPQCPFVSDSQGLSIARQSKAFQGDNLSVFATETKGQSDIPVHPTLFFILIQSGSIKLSRQSFVQFSKYRVLIKNMVYTGEKLDIRSRLINAFQNVRVFTEQLCEPLETEDFIVQSMPEVSPTRWHIAHTSWFFETFILEPAQRGYKSPHPLYNYFFNSYYNAVGEQFPRPNRGLLSRPSVKDIFAYRQHTDKAVLQLLNDLDSESIQALEATFMLGLEHEQQHQELMLSDIKHVFFQNPLYPAYTVKPFEKHSSPSTQHQWTAFEGGKVRQGHTGDPFCFDNETPQHEYLLPPFEIGNRLITNGEYLSFIEAQGYEQPSLWLSDGWALLRQEAWKAPLYWVLKEGHWHEFTLRGLTPLQLNAPVAHLSYYEANAYANWVGARLPSEYEWEHAAQKQPLRGNFVQQKYFHPTPAGPESIDSLGQMFGDVWEWTQSPYSPYPGFKPANGAIGEYNGKFMSSQMVLKGGSCVSSQDHLRATYRNFFYPHSRWQFMGLRLARDI